jgi:predicted nucleotidyltransferase/uncharacterized protein (DUF433 family)
MSHHLAHLISTTPDGQPVLTGTSITVESILEKLRDGEWLHDILTAYHLGCDSYVEAAVRHAQSLPQEHPLRQLYQAYQQQHQQKVQCILAQFKQHAQAIYGDRLKRIILFGSQARGDAWPGSDVDVLVVLKESLDTYADGRLVTEFIAKISIETGELISCVFMDETRFEHSQESLLADIRHDGISL